MTDEKFEEFYDRQHPIQRRIVYATVPSETELPAWFDTFLTNVCELSDRNSPAEEQDAVIATLEELSNCALNAIEQCAASAPMEKT